VAEIDLGRISCRYDFEVERSKVKVTEDEKVSKSEEEEDFA